MSRKWSLNKNLILIAGIILMSFCSGSAQEKSNLEVMNELVDSSVTEAVSFIPDSVTSIKPVLNQGILAVFNHEVISSLSKKGYNLVSGDNSFEFQYIIKNTGTSYGDIFRKGFLGDYYIPREITLSGNVNFNGKSVFTREFNYTFHDTVKVDSVSSLENPSYPFTQGNVPSESFFPGILEPVIAVGTAALAVILFFTIRSK